MAVLSWDSEVYKNYYLLALRDVDTGAVQAFEMFDGQRLDGAGIRAAVKGNTLVGFNSTNYDLPILTLAMSGAAPKVLKECSDLIIQNNMRPWNLEELYGIEIPKGLDHIDLIEVAPGKASLKGYGGRLHARKLQDLPVEHTAEITADLRPVLRTYCGNDLDLTAGLYKFLLPQIELRTRLGEKYGVELRSKSDAQIAEAVIVKEVARATGRDVYRPEFGGGRFRYQRPAFIAFETANLRALLDTVCRAEFSVPENGKVLMPDALADLKIAIGDGVYKLGVGGLHSQEKGIAHRAAEDWRLIDRDVTSYYPAIIIGQGLAPPHMGKAFSAVYQSLVAQRVAAKRTGDKVAADGLKITVNGSFGKFGSKWSKLYAPDLLIQTTLTGQLALLMLIERLELAGIRVVSANTDGVVMRCPRALWDKMDEVVWWWETDTGFDTEATEYAALYSRDVNNYIAIKKDGGVKVKGAYAPPGLQKNPANQVSVDAVVAYLQHGTSVEDTVNSCADVRKFITVRQVSGGAVKDGEYLGKTVRWYYSIAAAGAIHYKINGYTVARSEGAQPCMELPDRLPDDLNHQWYVDEARSILADVGATA